MRKEILINKTIKLLHKKFPRNFHSTKLNKQFLSHPLNSLESFSTKSSNQTKQKSLNLYQIFSSFSDTKVFQIEIAESINRVVKVFDNISC